MWVGAHEYIYESIIPFSVQVMAQPVFENLEQRVWHVGVAVGCPVVAEQESLLVP